MVQQTSVQGDDRRDGSEEEQEEAGRRKMLNCFLLGKFLNFTFEIAEYVLSFCQY